MRLVMLLQSFPYKKIPFINKSCSSEDHLPIIRLLEVFASKMSAKCLMTTCMTSIYRTITIFAHTILNNNYSNRLKLIRISTNIKLLVEFHFSIVFFPVFCAISSLFFCSFYNVHNEYITSKDWDSLFFFFVPQYFLSFPFLSTNTPSYHPFCFYFSPCSFSYSWYFSI